MRPSVARSSRCLSPGSNMPIARPRMDGWIPGTSPGMTECYTFRFNEQERPMSNTPRRAGRHFLQIPGPTPVPDRILRAMDKPTIDHRGPEFQQLGQRVLAEIKTIFKTNGHVFLYPASGTGAWEAALVNVLSPGDRVLMYETGHFATLWKNMAAKLGALPEFLESDWRTGVDPNRIEQRLRADSKREIKAVCVVHNETSTGVTSHVTEIRKAIDAA